MRTVNTNSTYTTKPSVSYEKTLLNFTISLCYLIYVVFPISILNLNILETYTKLKEPHSTRYNAWKSPHQSGRWNCKQCKIWNLLLHKWWSAEPSICIECWAWHCCVSRSPWSCSSWSRIYHQNLLRGSFVFHLMEPFGRYFVLKYGDKAASSL